MTFAEKGASRYLRIGHGRYTRDELISAAYMGLVVAAKKFDASRGVKFTTYAFQWIDQHLKRHHMKERRASGWMYHYSTADQKAGKKGMERVVQMAEWPVNEDGEPLDIGAPVPHECDERDFYKEQRQAELVIGMARGKRSRAMVALRLKGKTLEHIGKEFGVSKERVRQIVTPVIEAATARFGGSVE